MIVVRQYGEGRIFHTALGHVWKGSEVTRASHADAQFRQLIVRGTEWAATGEVRDGHVRPNELCELEQQSGWKLLFDGETTKGWRAYGGEQVPDGWQVISGCLVRSGRAGDLITLETFEDFEFEFEWKLAAGVNSGVKIRVHETPERGAPIGPEYQILDDNGHENGSVPKTSAAAMYALVEPTGKQLAAVGSFNHSRILARGTRLEHWLNGVRVLAVDLDSADFQARKAASKFARVQDFGRGAGHIALQDHGGEVWYRSLRLRELPQPTGERVDLLPAADAATLTGWFETGDAVYSVEDDAILGQVGGGGQSFLLSERSYGDFVFEVDVMTEAPGNSGIQVRSHQNENGRVYGYQIEIDPSARAWSGGLYDEGRRAWLSSLKGKAAARASYRHRQWNRFRIECIGPWIRVSVNGVPTVDYLDPLDLEGHIGLQVHSGNSTRVRWRRPTLWDLGRRRWEPIFDGQSLHGWELKNDDDTGQRWRVDEGQLVADPGAGALRSGQALADGGLRLRFRQEQAGFTIGTGASEVDATKLGEGVYVHADGWYLLPTELGLEPGKQHELSLCKVGARIAIHSAGRLLADVRHARFAQARPISLTPASTGVAIASIESIR